MASLSIEKLSITEDIIKEATELVDDLYDYRNHFFDKHNISEALKKHDFVKEKLESTLIKLRQLQGYEDVGDGMNPSNDKPTLLYLYGRALNVMINHDPEAEKLLSRAVKLQPTLVDAWNELGECYWKRSDIQTAKKCFEGALKHKINKVSLRCLSIIYRHEASNNPNLPIEKRIFCIETGLKKAKEAVHLDTGDGMSWSILGNAYFSAYFSISHDPQALKQAMSAYKQAEKDVVAKCCPDLHYNKGIAQKYEEDFSGALTSFRLASVLDPTFEEAQLKERNLLKILNDINNLLALKGKLKSKRLNSLIESLSTKNLCPSLVSTSNLISVNFRDLVEGFNSMKIVTGCVICSIQNEEEVPFTFCLVDCNGDCLAVNLYNLAPGKGVIIGDVVAVCQPLFRRIVIENENVINSTTKKVSLRFNLIRVENPVSLIINGKQAALDLRASTELRTFMKNP